MSPTAASTARAGTRIGMARGARSTRSGSRCSTSPTSTSRPRRRVLHRPHGTGVALPALHAHLRGLTLVSARGEVLHASRDERPELFDAARVAMGHARRADRVELDVRPALLAAPPGLAGQRTEKLVEESAAARGRRAAHRHASRCTLPLHPASARASCTTEVPAQGPTHVEAADESVLSDLRQLRDWVRPLPRPAALGRAAADRPEPEGGVDRPVVRSSRTVRPTRFNESVRSRP